jgi:hypothetical protein
MGYRSHWIAIEHDEASPLLDALGLEPTEQSEDWMDTGVWLARSGPWWVVCGSGWDHMDTVPEAVAVALSHHHRALFWQASDGSMTARMSEWRAGETRWELTHADVETTFTGAPPDIAARLHEQARERQAAEEGRVDHVYEVAHALGEALTGFRHDRDNGLTYTLLRARPVPESVPKTEDWWQTRLTFEVQTGLPWAVTVDAPAFDGDDVTALLRVHHLDGETTTVRGEGRLVVVPSHEGRDRASVEAYLRAWRLALYVALLHPEGPPPVERLVHTDVLRDGSTSHWDRLRLMLATKRLGWPSDPRPLEGAAEQWYPGQWAWTAPDVSRERMDEILGALFPVDSADGTLSLQFVSTEWRDDDLLAVFRAVGWNVDGDTRTVATIREQPCWVVSRWSQRAPQTVRNFLTALEIALTLRMSSLSEYDAVRLPHEWVKSGALDDATGPTTMDYLRTLLRRAYLG